MSIILGALATAGLDFVTDLIKDHGEDLALEGIKKVTNIDLKSKKVEELTQEEIARIKEQEIAIMSLDFEKLKLELENKKEDNRHEESFYTQAHESYKIHHEATDKLSFQIMRENLIIIGVLVLIQVLVVSFVTNAALVATIATLIGGIINSLLSERQQVVGFRFGSSSGSKQKGAQLAQLNKEV